MSTEHWSTSGTTDLAIGTGYVELSMRKTDFNSFEDALMVVVRGLTKLRSIWISRTYPSISVGRDFSVHYSCNLPRASARSWMGNKTFQSFNAEVGNGASTGNK